MRDIKFKALDKGKGGGWHSEEFTLENLSSLIGSDNIEIVQFTGIYDINSDPIYDNFEIKLHQFLFNGSSEVEKESLGVIQIKEYGLWFETKETDFEGENWHCFKVPIY